METEEAERRADDAAASFKVALMSAQALLVRTDRIGVHYIQIESILFLPFAAQSRKQDQIRLSGRRVALFGSRRKYASMSESISLTFGEMRGTIAINAPFIR